MNGEPKSAAVQYPPDLHTMAKTISAHDGRSVSAIVADASRKAVTRRYREIIREQSAAMPKGK